MDYNIPWFHIVVLVPCKLSDCHESHPNKDASKAKLSFKSSSFCQLCCNIEPARQHIHIIIKHYKLKDIGVMQSREMHYYGSRLEEDRLLPLYFVYLDLTTTHYKRMQLGKTNDFSNNIFSLEITIIDVIC